MSERLVKIVLMHWKIRLAARRYNLSYLERKVRELMENEAGDARPDVLVLPPYPLTGPVIGYYRQSQLRNHLRNSAEMLGRRNSLIHLSRLASELGVDIVVGPVIERAGPRLYVTVAHIDRTGSLAGKYRKLAVTSEERKLGISPGQAPGIFTIRRRFRLGVFVDEDLAYPEVFRMLQAGTVNFIVGFMLPYPSDYFELKHDSNKMLTMDRKYIDSMLVSRARETGVPMILLGGVVESTSNRIDAMAYMDTIPVEPDVGLVEDRVKSVDRAPSFLTVDVDTAHSVPNTLDIKIAEVYLKFIKTRRS